ncbi:MAG: RidA family protein [bacterium]|jgi:enamine deaminase RidA (YjgF/YER057c/UK114 family)|nr:hypothetical protein [Betaproteobacteria bacterium]
MSKPFFKLLAKWPTGVAAGPFLFYSGQMGLGAGGRPVRSFAEVEGAGPGPGNEHGWVRSMEGPVGGQAIALYERYRTLLGAQGLSLANIVRYHIFQRDKRSFPVFDRVRRSYEKAPPASTAVGLGRFEPTDAVRLNVDSIVYRGTGARPEGRAVLAGSGKHAAAAHFSHVIGAGPWLFLAGQIPIDTSRSEAPLIRGYADIPKAGRFLSVGRSHEDARNGPIAAQTWFTYDLIRKHLEGAGSSMDQVMNLVVYLQDMRDFPTFHRVHEHFFGARAPALTVIEAGEVGHKGTLIEIEPTAIVPGKGVKLEALAPDAATCGGRMSAAVQAGGLAFLSGIPGVGPDGAPAQSLADLPAAWRKRAPAGPARGPAATMLAQALAVAAHLEARMKALGHPLSRIVHLTIFLDDIDAFAAIAPVFTKLFGRHRPALYVIELARPAPIDGARLSATAIAWTGDGDPAPIDG